MPRLAWFSPMPPARTGVAVYSAGLLPLLRRDHQIDVYVDEPIAADARRHTGPCSVRSAHDFVWAHHLAPYDLTVFQLGNSSAHNFLWPYLFRYPGLVVLHDAQLHHARAAALLWQRRVNDYRAEFAGNHPEVSPDLAELAIAGFDTHLYYSWPMTRLIVRASRMTAVHSPLMMPALLEESPGASVEAIRLGHGQPVTIGEAALAGARVRARHRVPEGSVLFGVFGGLTPEKRVPQVLEAFTALRRYAPAARLLLVGAPAGHYDVAADISRLGLRDAVTVTGYVEDDNAFTEYVAACDVSINLRWPTAREVSGPWLRALAAGRPTITIDLWHTADVPALDPRTWTAVSRATPAGPPVTVSLDILDEDHSLRLALRRLASDAELRATLGRAAAEYWQREHSHERMLADYRRVLIRAIASPVPAPSGPKHLRADGTERVHELLEPFGLGAAVWSRI